jgi:hypothetical protein
MAALATVPMLVPKSDLLKPLKALVAFDPKGSPYVGVQLGVTPKFYRSSAHGYIMSRGYGDEKIAHVSLSNLVDCLKNLPEDAVQLGLDNNGILRIHGTSSDIFESETRVHTVAAGQAGLKKHDIGDVRFEVDKDAFSRIDIRAFKTVTPPVLAKGRLMLATDAGATVMWDGPESIHKLPDIYPRESFLRMVSGGAEVRHITITANGYWGAEINDLITYTKGHVIGRQIFDNYTASGSEIAKLPAQRLVVGLDAAVGLLEPTERVDVDPKLGILAKGKFGDNRNSLGETGNWARFGMLAKTAKVVSEALSQTTEDEAVLYTLPPTSTGSPILRLKRGPFEINFRAYGHDDRK